MCLLDGAPCRSVKEERHGEARRAHDELDGWAVGHCVARKPQESTGFGDCRVRKLNVTRSDFERTCDGLFQRVLAPVSALLEEANMPKGEIDEVVLVGGSSRIPRIRDELRAFFDIDHLNTEIDPDVTVAIGAASIVD